ncbi:MAG: hypothetical protein LAO78_23000 [Acidobacteriia bacterium]|nr:hypothetical protein [Terriglobia bacterium]
MKDSIRSTLFLTAIAATTAVAQSAKPAAGDNSSLTSDWRGTSICVVRESACHDEKALYHVKKLGDQPNRFSLQADKIVDEKPVTMGTTECNYQPEGHALTCELPKSVLHLTWQGSTLEGTMNLTDGTLWRNINLKHD